MPFCAITWTYSTLSQRAPASSTSRRKAGVEASCVRHLPHMARPCVRGSMRTARAVSRPSPRAPASSKSRRRSGCDDFAFSPVQMARSSWRTSMLMAWASPMPSPRAPLRRHLGTGQRRLEVPGCTSLPRRARAYLLSPTPWRGHFRCRLSEQSPRRHLCASQKSLEAPGCSP